MTADDAGLAADAGAADSAGPAGAEDGPAGAHGGPERPARVAGLLLAAGGGSRLGGRPKALLPYRGRPLVEHAVRVLRDGGCDDVTVVLGASAEQVRATADLSGFRVVDNPDWATGMGSSLRAGLAALPADCDAAVVTLVDMPGVGAPAVARLIAAHVGDGADLAAATYDGKRSHPVLFAARWWPEIDASAQGDAGARVFLAAHSEQLRLVECGDVAEAYDIDTPEDLKRLE
ncbi:nucleotidyltransferase family protein [Yinghuangia seranimata]|uniref:nucleotidyltransferase family protein n=1 Tax=Yinghuangia seranimata TaxID=408067 RepID=UPI00248BBDE2|nr:nucleotidyltransferase family protein [Yinghuangia seranimata]MDI2131534.1 nucleotidyltransferase family protein [Yinghuangia seranimata]